jgi:hypothetical protein
MTYANHVFMCDCGEVALRYSAFDSFAICSECGDVHVATNEGGRRVFDVLSLEFVCRELVGGAQPRFGGET